MKKTVTFITLFSLISSFSIHAQPCFTCFDAPKGTIFCDDFESDEPLTSRYFESSSNVDVFAIKDGVGRDGSKGIRIKWEVGQVGAGGIKKSFGRTPSNYIGKYAVNPNEDYNEIYWRIDVKSQKGWTGGGPDKLSRAMTMAKSNWSQGMIAHIWSSKNYLGMDPASGIDDNSQLVSTKYNDFDNLRWLGFKRGNIEMFSTKNSDKWYCIVAHAKLNTPGKKDGIFEFWINDTLQAGTYNLNWHGNWNSNSKNHTINAIFVENYWNAGSPVAQERYFDNFVISTKKIDCNCDVATKITAVTHQKSIIIYPNPIVDYLHIDVSRQIAMVGYTFHLFNSKGQQVMRSDEIKNIWNTQDLSDFNSGVYYYKISAHNETLQAGKLLVL